MSWRATAAVKEIRTGITRSEKFLLLILADYHNAETGQCDPTLKRLGEDALMTTRAAQIVIKSLEEKGFIRVEKRWHESGRNDSNQYWLTFIEGGMGETISPREGDPPIRERVIPRSGRGRSPDHPVGEAPIALTVTRTAKRTATGTASRARAKTQGGLPGLLRQMALRGDTL